MKQNWEIKKLGEICDKASSNVSQNQLTNEAGVYPIYGAGGFIKNVSFYHQDKEYVSIIKDGAGIGRIALLPPYSSIIGTLLYLIPKEILDIRYFYYFLSNIDFLKYKNGSTIPHIYFKDYSDEPILVPPLPEQQRIVAIIDKSFAAIAKAKANAEQNIINTKDLFESYLQRVFSTNGKDWEKKTLEQISETFGRGKSKHRPRNDKKLYGGDFPFIQTGDIRNCDHYITEYSQTYNDVGLAQSKLWQEGTICITIAANIAETGILTFDACFPDSVIGLVVNKELADTNFVEYLLQSFKARLQALGKGSAQANINMGTFENELFPFPSVKEQKLIVQKLDALSSETKKLETIYQQKFNDLEELKKSILQKAFSGELKTSKAEAV